MAQVRLAGNLGVVNKRTREASLDSTRGQPGVPLMWAHGTMAEDDAEMR